MLSRPYHTVFNSDLRAVEGTLRAVRGASNTLNPEASGGLVVVPGSHKFHGDLLSNYDHSDWDYIALRN